MLSPFMQTQPTLMRTQVPVGLKIMGTQILQSKTTGTKVPLIQIQINVLQ